MKKVTTLIKNFDELKKLYYKLPKEYRDFFIRLHGDVENITVDKVDVALDQCKRTFERFNLPTKE